MEGEENTRLSDDAILSGGNQQNNKVPRRKYQIVCAIHWPHFFSSSHDGIIELNYMVDAQRR